MKREWAAWLGCVLAAASVVTGDQVFWSNGDVWEGQILSSGQGELRLHDGQRLHQWRLDSLAALDWYPSTQRMERAWRFLEAGQTAKEFTGEAYPTVEFGCTATLNGGAGVSGHLLTTVFYLEHEGETRKIVVKRKMRGQAGETIADLLHPVRFVFDAPAVRDGRRYRVTVAGSPDHPAEVALVAALPTTTALPVKPIGQRLFSCEMSGSMPVWALREGAVLTVGWNDAATPALKARVGAALENDLRDFFDGRELLGVATNSLDDTVIALVLFSRKGTTTLEGKRTQPWRLEVCRWRMADDGQNQFAARAVLFRGIRSEQEPLPEIRISPELDSLKIEDLE